MRRGGFVLALLLALWVAPAMAQPSAHYHGSLIDSSGRPVNSGQVTVMVANTVTLATLYASSGGASQTNPLNTDGNGNFNFWIANGLYDLLYKKNGATIGARFEVQIANTLAGGSQPGVELNDTTIVGSATAVDFNEGFTVTASPSTEANVAFNPTTVVGSKTWGNTATDFNWAFDVPGDNPTFAFRDSRVVLISSAGSDATFQVGSAGQAGDIGIFNAAGNLLRMLPPASFSNWNFTFPTGPGTAGQMLLTNGTGIASWGDLDTTRVNATYWGNGTTTIQWIWNIDNGLSGFSGTDDFAMFLGGSSVDGKPEIRWVGADPILHFVIGQANASDPRLELWRSDGVTLRKLIWQASGSMTQDTTYTWPVDDGTSGQLLATNGSGVLSWASAAGVPDATTSVKGIVQLAGDLEGTAAAPTIKADAVALTTDTTGSYAAGDAEAGNATGLACTTCVDVSAETNLAVTAPVVLTGDTLSLGTVDISANTNLAVTSPITLTGDTISINTQAAATNTVTWGSGAASPIAWTYAVTGTDSLLNIFTGGTFELSAAGGGAGSLNVGSSGTTNAGDGSITVYSEQGATDFSFTFAPPTTMTEATNYKMPVDGGAPNQFLKTDGAFGSTILSWASTRISKGLTIEAPTASEDLTVVYVDHAITIAEVRCVNVGSSPSVTYNLKFDADRNAAGTSIFSGAQTCTSTTTGNSVTSFSAQPGAGVWLWLETTATSGTVTNSNITIVYDNN